MRVVLTGLIWPSIRTNGRFLCKSDGNKHSGFITVGKLFESLRKWRPLRKAEAPWS
jgi:hypothetical protein